MVESEEGTDEDNHCRPLLFEEFNVEDGGQFFCALLLILAMAVLSEGFSFLMWWQKFTMGSKKATIC